MSDINRIPSTCLYCKKDFLANIYQVKKGKGKYCSNSCSARSSRGTLEKNDKEIVFRNGFGVAHIQQTCKVCSKVFLAKLTVVNHGGGLYCSLSCKSKATVPKIWKAANHHLQVQACNAVRLAIYSGKLVRTGVCSVCGKRERSIGKRRIEFHHTDYAKPLDVVEMCQSCQWKEHYRLGRELNPV